MANVERLGQLALSGTRAFLRQAHDEPNVCVHVTWSLVASRVAIMAISRPSAGNQLTINPVHLSDSDWEAICAFFVAARENGKVVELSSHVELLTPAEAAKRLGLSR